MILQRIIILIVFLIVIYYASMIAHSVDLIKVTNRKTTFFKMLIPFYYWIEIKRRKSENPKKRVAKKTKTKK